LGFLGFFFFPEDFCVVGLGVFDVVGGAVVARVDVSSDMVEKCSVVLIVVVSRKNDVMSVVVVSTWPVVVENIVAFSVAVVVAASSVVVVAFV
jgi:hypothetical protein